MYSNCSRTFVTAVDVEVIKACLPETRQSRTIVHEQQTQLSAGGFAFFPTQLSGHPLLERLQHHRRRRFRRLADQQVHVIGHDHITHQQKLVPFANRSQRAHKQVSRANRSQQRQPSVTTEGHKVQIAAAVIAFQILGHERPPQEPTCNPDTWGTQHPESPYANSVDSAVVSSRHAFSSTRQIRNLVWATLYDGVGSVKGHEESASR